MDHKLSKASTPAESSFRLLYYGASGAAVPFKWESQPGTPKHDLYSDYSALPPLTPPPSYLARAQPGPVNNHPRRRKLKMVVLLAALVRRRSHVSPASSYSPSSSTSSSNDVVSSYYSKSRKTREPLMFALMGGQEEELRAAEMRVCFSGGRLGRSLKNALFSVVGCRRRR